MAGRSREAYGLVVSLAVCVCVSCYETWCAAHTQAVDQVSASAVDVNQTSAICDYCKSPGVHGGHPPGDLTDPCPPFVRRLVFVFFFFQAEDGIRDVAVTGVQTCALPICASIFKPAAASALIRRRFCGSSKYPRTAVATTGPISDTAFR